MCCIIILNSGSEAFLPLENNYSHVRLHFCSKLVIHYVYKISFFCAIKNIYLHNLCFYSLL